MEELIQFATTSLENGGLSLIYPGVFHKLMRTAVEEMRKPKGANIFHRLLSEKRKLETKNQETPKVGYVLNSYDMLGD